MIVTVIVLLVLCVAWLTIVNDMLRHELTARKRELLDVHLRLHRACLMATSTPQKREDFAAVIGRVEALRTRRRES